mmetsp:Transcript_12777/g.32294  ORF Transcript_12777/g.32294 Transcript_12777/m.32294 type:complete len:303 (+) Transcript_12777:510-1418(+)
MATRRRPLHPHPLSRSWSGGRALISQQRTPADFRHSAVATLYQQQGQQQQERWRRRTRMAAVRGSRRAIPPPARSTTTTRRYRNRAGSRRRMATLCCRRRNPPWPSLQGGPPPEHGPQRSHPPPPPLSLLPRLQQAVGGAMWTPMATSRGPSRRSSCSAGGTRGSWGRIPGCGALRTRRGQAWRWGSWCGSGRTVPPPRPGVEAMRMAAGTLTTLRRRSRGSLKTTTPLEWLGSRTRAGRRLRTCCSSPTPRQATQARQRCGQCTTRARGASSAWRPGRRRPCMRAWTPGWTPAPWRSRCRQ